MDKTTVQGVISKSPSVSIGMVHLKEAILASDGVAPGGVLGWRIVERVAVWE